VRGQWEDKISKAYEWALKLMDKVSSWLRDFDQNAARHEVTLHEVIATLTKYVWPLDTTRPKGKMNAAP